MRNLSAAADRSLDGSNQYLAIHWGRLGPDLHCGAVVRANDYTGFCPFRHGTPGLSPFFERWDPLTGARQVGPRRP